MLSVTFEFTDKNDITEGQRELLNWLLCGSQSPNANAVIVDEKPPENKTITAEQIKELKAAIKELKTLTDANNALVTLQNHGADKTLTLAKACAAIQVDAFSDLMTDIQDQLTPASNDVSDDLDITDESIDDMFDGDDGDDTPITVGQTKESIRALASGEGREAARAILDTHKVKKLEDLGALSPVVLDKLYHQIPKKYRA